MTHSYSALENELRHRLRDDLNHADEVEDVDNAFAFAVRTLLVRATEDNLRFTDRDIRLLPGDKTHYRLSEVITTAAPFQAACAGSDLLVIISRFAEEASHRYTTLHKHADKIRAREHKEH
jgi:hypothetical protein